jgi:DNA-binding transcriptional MerR regulator
MTARSMLKIGEFARVGQVSIATLRHYDQLGLLKPSALDPESGYRYYSLDQLPRLNRILALKDLGFPLEQIAQLLEESLPLEVLHGMFRLKQAQTQQIIDTEQARLARIAARLRQIEQEENMPDYEVRLKQVDPLLVASTRGLVALGSNFVEPRTRLQSYLEQQEIAHSGPDMLLWYSRHEAREDRLYADVEFARPLRVPLPGNEHITVHTLPEHLMACTVFTGDVLASGQAFAVLHRWLDDNSYRLVGPPRQIYLQGLHQDTSVVEVQFPVGR